MLTEKCFIEEKDTSRFHIFSIASGLPRRHQPTEGDQVVRNHSEPNPTLDAILPRIEAAIQTMPALQYTDASFAAGPPTLALLEPSLLLDRKSVV